MQSSNAQKSKNSGRPEGGDANLLGNFNNGHGKKAKKESVDKSGLATGAAAAEQKQAAVVPPRSGRTTRGIKLGNLNENALAKNSAAT